MVALATARRVAILGGDARQEGRGTDFGELGEFGEAVYFQGRRFGGNGELRRLEQAIRAGSFTLVVILARWNGHATTSKVLRLCRSRGVTVMIVP